MGHRNPHPSHPHCPHGGHEDHHARRRCSRWLVQQRCGHQRRQERHELQLVCGMKQYIPKMGLLQYVPLWVSHGEPRMSTPTIRHDTSWLNQFPASVSFALRNLVHGGMAKIDLTRCQLICTNALETATCCSWNVKMMCPASSCWDPHIHWHSNVFSLIERAKTHLRIEEYTVSQTTLEQIFNSFESQQTQEKGVARGMESAINNNQTEVLSPRVPSLSALGRMSPLHTASSDRRIRSIMAFILPLLSSEGLRGQTGYNSSASEQVELDITFAKCNPMTDDPPCMLFITRRCDLMDDMRPEGNLQMSVNFDESCMQEQSQVAR
ncbi:hypothetical protein AC1031_008713 [Aphanomyces cochlioides]|nr:hypothetical protein AC1031_008713 [Aphanomyces cochlioides]